MNSKLKKAESHYYRGLTYNEQGNWGLAEEEFLKALVIYSQLKIWDKVVCTQCSLGNVAFNKGNVNETLKHWNNALTTYEENLNQNMNAANLCIDIGDLYYDLKVKNNNLFFF